MTKIKLCSKIKLFINHLEENTRDREKAKCQKLSPHNNPRLQLDFFQCFTSHSFTMYENYK